jgi:hypothetical protein
MKDYCIRPTTLIAIKYTIKFDQKPSASPHIKRMHALFYINMWKRLESVS